MEEDTVLNHLREAGVIAILRGEDTDRLYHRGIELAEMGCTAIEVTLDSPNALEIVGRLRHELGADVMIGVGTLLNLEQVTDCRVAGAEFALSPINPEGMVDCCHEAGLLAVPGVANTSELEDVMDQGALIAKLFPSTNWSSEELSGFNIPWMPVGGVDAEDLWNWLNAGAWCVGMGTHLCGSDLNGGEEVWTQDEQQRARGIFMELQRRRLDA